MYRYLTVFRCTVDKPSSNLRCIEYLCDGLAVLQLVVAAAVVVDVVVGLELEGAGVPLHQLHHLVVRDSLVGLDDLWIFDLNYFFKSFHPN